MSQKNSFKLNKKLNLCLVSILILSTLTSVFIQAAAMAPSWSCTGTVTSSTGGALSGALAKLYGYSTGGGEVPESIELDLVENRKDTNFITVTGSWILLDSDYTDAAGEYDVSTSYYTDKTSMKVVISKSGYYPQSEIFSNNAGSHSFSPTLQKIVYPPPAPTNLQWSSTFDMAINTPEIFLSWTVDGNPQYGRLQVSYDTVIETVILTSTELAQGYMFYNVPEDYNAYPLAYQLGLKNYDSSTGLYSSYAYTEWATVIGYDNHDGFYIGYRHVGSTSWTRDGKSAYLSFGVRGTKATIEGVNFMMLSVDVYFVGTSDQTLLSDGIKIRVQNLDNSQNIKLVTQDNHLLMRAVNANGGDLQPIINTQSQEDVTGDALFLLSTVVRVAKLFQVPYSPLALTTLGWLSLYNAVMGPEGWFAHPDSEYASGVNAYCQASYRTAGPLSVENRPIELWATCKFLVEPSNAHTGSIRLTVSSNDYLWNGRLGMYWIDSYMTTSMDIYYGI